MERSKSSESLVQFIKFALVGASNTLVTLIVGFLLKNLVGVYAAQTIGYICGLINSYVWNTVWTFKKERKRNASEMIKFVVVNVAVWAISLGLIALLQNVFHLDSWWSGLLGESWLIKLVDGERFCMFISTMLCIALNFLGNKLFVFKNKEFGKGTDNAG
ncbi:MAG: GtrA family protein [Clostridia bacterium]|nr:GtrA family protein [Clostridia bacterium]